ncbi:class III extradiol ring-cleavage dioxygenase [Synechocystis sp. PCC 7338]|uniref:DODA-type extradiol aromatic ring-opening family dioxygenase n=1 Tax=Synechocystis sp. PCC 7338 TaxID=2732530 RepID=UPI001BB064D0|nr:class III extradiol ring-cleavage dioxygenase [Synechocystis sp. PCC 7338]QUS61128.1 dioxygenase [Synechocystis sp. PCC 7338]
MTRLPTIFISHGAPSLILEKDQTTEFFAELGRKISQPEGIICISAHWESPEPLVAFNPQCQTIHDFLGFPEALYQLQYSATGSEVFANQAIAALKFAGFAAKLHPLRGFDHGVWVPLKLMYPEANIPVIQLSLQPNQNAEYHWKMGQALQDLRQKGILILASGSATHDLQGFRHYPKDADPLDYALSFDQWLVDAIENGNHQALLNYKQTAPEAQRNHPTAEHLLPLFVAMGAATQSPGKRIHHGFTYGTLSMAAFQWE